MWQNFIARKLANILEFNFIEVRPSDLARYTFMWTGEDRGLFAQAREKAPTLCLSMNWNALIPIAAVDSVGHHYRAEVNEFLSIK